MYTKPNVSQHSSDLRFNTLEVDAPECRVRSLGRALGTVDVSRSKAMRSHKQPTAIWFTKGQGQVTIAGVTASFSPHSFIFMPPNTMYGYEHNLATQGYILHMPNDPWLNLPGEPLHFKVRDSFDQAEFTGMIDKFKQEVDGDAHNKERGLSLRAGIIALWIERQQVEHGKEASLTQDASRRLAVRFTNLVEERFHETHSIADFAAELGVTPTHLSRACKAACGQSASEILAERVSFEARRMLSDTPHTISEIGEQLGFSSAAYFSRFFQKHSGQSPREYRKVS